MHTCIISIMRTQFQHGLEALTLLTNKNQTVLILGWLEMYLSGNIWISIFPPYFGLDEVPGYPTSMAGVSVM